MSAGRSHPDVGPASWEIPAAAVLMWLTVAALLLPAGRAAAVLLTGGGWMWPTGAAALLASVGGLLTGDASAGLTTTEAAAVPSAAAVHAAIGGVLVLFLAGSGGAAWAAHRWLSGAGMATRGQVAEVLGRARCVEQGRGEQVEGLAGPLRAVDAGRAVEGHPQLPRRGDGGAAQPPPHLVRIPGPR